MSAERSVRELMNLGFTEARAREAVSSVGDPTDANLAMNWLFDHGEEDKGGAVEFKHCPHVDELGKACLVQREQLVFGEPCVHGCAGSENWVCLHDGKSRCGRYGRRHGLQHWEQTKKEQEANLTVAQAATGQVSRGHCLALSLSDLSVWCYECDGYVQHKSLAPLVKRMEQLKFGDVSGDDAAPTSCARQSPALGTPISTGVQSAHGRHGDASWPLPKLARACDDEARPGYRTMLAHEYLDEDEVLKAKVRLLASLILRSRNCVAYTGAGISTASGINDYATKAGDTVTGSRRKISPWEAQPTLAHRTLVALHKAGHLKHWVQQNHDGLPQKAGFPSKDLNEIHGAWYDPSNPVVPMSGTLRTDLIEQMLHWEDRVDLCLSLGTSMVGMNADRMAIAPAERMRRGVPGALGTVIVALQQTQYDNLSSLRIFATIDRVMELLADEMTLTVPPVPALRPWGTAPILRDLPYSPNGCKNLEARLTLDFQVGRRFRVVNQPDWDCEAHGNICEVVEGNDAMTREGHIALRFGQAGTRGSIVRALGRWWLDDAVAGLADTLPVVPC
mmetsp:Transcript_118057/g.220649  ORF Transcript_118057/g.220649 Transcript_118057/m.220649 type:complete len:562 (-) Transcript_118057:199-1884(-)